MLARRRLAAPFVVTSIVLPACGTPPEPAAPQQPAVASAPTTTSAPVETAPPPPTETAQPTPSAAPTTDPTPPRKWLVNRESDGTCRAELDVECDPSHTCNPPAPVKYDCPKDATEYPVHVSRAAGEASCTAIIAVHRTPIKCRPGMRCNPPPPFHSLEVPCPE